MSIKVWILFKCFGLFVSLTIYSFLYENYINSFILNSIGGIKEHFQNSTVHLPN